MLRVNATIDDIEKRIFCGYSSIIEFIKRVEEKIILSLFHNEFNNKSNNTGARMLVSIYHMPLKWHTCFSVLIIIYLHRLHVINIFLKLPFCRILPRVACPT